MDIHGKDVNRILIVMGSGRLDYPSLIHACGCSPAMSPCPMLSQLWTARLLIGVLYCFILPSGVRAATSTVTVNQTNVLTAPFLPSALSDTQVGNSPAWRDRLNILGFNGFTEGLEPLTWGAAVDLDWNTYRTKRITLGGDTTFTFLNSPTSSTNVERMVVQVVGDGVSTVVFTGATFQTAQLNTPPAGVRSLYIFESDVDGVAGYCDVFGSGGSSYIIGPLTPGYIPVANTTTNVTDSTMVQVNTNVVQQLGGFALTNGVWTLGSNSTTASIGFNAANVDFNADGGGHYTFRNNAGGIIGRFLNSQNLAIGPTAAEPSFLGGVSWTGEAISPFYALTVTAATQIPISATWFRLTAASAIVMTNTPLFTSVKDGDDVYLMGSSDVNTITLQDNATLPGSNLHLGDTTRVLSNGTVLHLHYRAADTLWYEQGFGGTGGGGGSSPFASDGTTVYLDPVVDSLSVTNSVADGGVAVDFNTTVLQTSDTWWRIRNLDTNVVTLSAGPANAYHLQLLSDFDNYVLLNSGLGAGENSVQILENSNGIFQANVNGMVTTGSITTGDPGVGGTGDIKFGGLLSCSAITMVVTNYIPVSINGNTNFVIPLATFTP